MSTFRTFFLGFILAKTLLAIYIAAWYFNMPKELELSAFGGFVAINGALVGMVVRLLQGSPAVANQAIHHALNGDGLVRGVTKSGSVINHNGDTILPPGSVDVAAKGNTQS